jgi:hypothetical protein
MNRLTHLVTSSQTGSGFFLNAGDQLLQVLSQMSAVNSLNARQGLK